MKIRVDKAYQWQNTAIQRVREEPIAGGTATIRDNRPSTIYKRKLKETMNANNVSKAIPIQRKVNNKGLPGNLKNGIESLSGYSMDDVRVHYNSSKPAQLNAHAYAQGTDIHLAPGQEKHLPHEAWHVVQQKQGRVKPTMQLKGKVNINDDARLEKEADVMGQKAIRLTIQKYSSPQKNYTDTNGTVSQEMPIQLTFFDDLSNAVWNFINGLTRSITLESVLDTVSDLIAAFSIYCEAKSLGSKILLQIAKILASGEAARVAYNKGEKKKVVKHVLKIIAALVIIYTEFYRFKGKAEAKLIVTLLTHFVPKFINGIEAGVQNVRAPQAQANAG